MAYVLGISAFYHDSAAALLKGGDILAAAQEERFSRKKHDARFPRHAMNYCLGEAFIEPTELDAVVFYDNPLLTFDRFIKNSLAVAPEDRDQFMAGCCSLLGAKARFRDKLEETLGEAPRLLATRHHMAHAASCFYPSPFEEAAILTIDGVGEWATCALGVGAGNGVEILKELRYPHSLGLLYSAFTQYCGFKVNSGEYKLMGLAPYGEPRFADLIRDALVDIREDGSFRLNARAFGFLEAQSMINARFEEIFGGPPRAPEAVITRREMDLAASIQLVTEEIVLRLARHVMRETGMRNLTMAGGVALNCVANGRVLREAGVDGLFVQPAAGDAGGALGAALQVAHELFGAPRKISGTRDSMQGARLGPAFSSHDIDAILDRYDARSRRIEDDDERADVIAEALERGAVVGHFNGRMEFGPRALGARSILGDPRRPDMQRRMNLKIKFRESFRPFAPMVLEEDATDIFELESQSPYMLIVAPVRETRRKSATRALGDDDDMMPMLNDARSDVPAVTHVDYSARVQTVGAEADPSVRRVLEAFRRRTGCPVLVNTSFNVRGEPIVCTPLEAYRCFMRTDIDMLVLGDFVLLKQEQPALASGDGEVEYELD